ncbi:hypothetical protein B0I37DRAFT_376943 [Chaetomium sp. MPI-CAGE-AT-0009]|nr:hypothetical protein B0I37DRAFT_376943 [Chaetomium sp. MPI-CAGE-AT-0009]
MGLLLGNNGVKPNTPNNDSRTPLLWAAGNEHDAVVGLLLGNSGVKPDTPDNEGRTPLHTAVLSGHSDIATKLISTSTDIHSQDTYSMTPLRLAIENQKLDCIELLLRNSTSTEEIMADQWLTAYKDQKDSQIIMLSKGQEEGKHVEFISLGELDKAIGTAGRRLFIFTNGLNDIPWRRHLIPSSDKIRPPKQPETLYERYPHGAGFSFAFASWFPSVGDPGVHKDLTVDWKICLITWTMTLTQRGSSWQSIDHFSLLSYGWIPDDGADFIKQFIDHLLSKWLELLNGVEEHLTMRRDDQLNEYGQNSNFVQYLARDALKLAELRKTWRSQVDYANAHAAEHCRHHSDSKGHHRVQSAIDRFESGVSTRIIQLDQTLKDLLQLEFAWVSTNEAHRSSSIATSMKRLSWITFIFLPIMFASSLWDECGHIERQP